MADSSLRAAGKHSFCRGIPVQVTVTENVKTGVHWEWMDGNVRAWKHQQEWHQEA